MRALFLGGDLRQKYANDFMCQNKVDSEVFMNFVLDDNIKAKINSASIIGLPIPLLNKDMYINMPDNNSIKPEDILMFLNKGCVVFGGNIPNYIREIIFQHNCAYFDYFDIESFQINNALLSAEGGIYYAKQRLERSIHSSNIAILGFGRIGKVLAYLLHLQGAKITICARKDSDYTWSKLAGFDGFKIKTFENESNLNLIENKYDIIFNTIPFWIMGESFVKTLSDDTLIIDIASYPFGIDESLVKKYNLKYFRESGIPGRYAPKSAGEIMAKTIIDYIN